LHLARCDAVIVVRELLHEFAYLVVGLCRTMHIPLFYLTDDNFIALSAELKEFSYYTDENVRAMLTGFEGVICSSEPLADYFYRHELHPSIEKVDAVFDLARRKKVERIRRPADNVLRFGFVGSEFRIRPLELQVLPALERLSREVRLSLICRGNIAKAEDLPFEVRSI